MFFYKSCAFCKLLSPCSVLHTLYACVYLYIGKGMEAYIALNLCLVNKHIDRVLKIMSDALTSFQAC